MSSELLRSNIAGLSVEHWLANVTEQAFGNTIWSCCSLIMSVDSPSQDLNFIF